jgi:hypothetical protein
VARDLLEQIVPASRVPVYSLATTYMGTGSVGGVLVDPTTDARMAVDLVRRILNGEKPETLGTVRESATYCCFHDPDTWQKYRWYLVAGLLAILFESLFLGWLALEVRRRRKSEAMLKDLSDS